MKKILLVLSVCVQSTIAQKVHHFPENNLLGSSAFKVHEPDLFAMFMNPAAIASVHDFGIGISGERKYFLKELSLYNLASVVPLKESSIGFSISYYGDQDFNESQLSILYAKQLGSVEMALQFLYYSIQAKFYGRTHIVDAAFSLRWILNDNLCVGTNITNLARTKFDYGRMGFVYSLGMSYAFSKTVIISFLIRKKEQQSIELNGWLEYELPKNVVLKAGMNSGNKSPWLTIGFVFKKIYIDLSMSYHLQLGTSPAMMIAYINKQKEL